MTPQENIERTAAELGLTMETVFVPFSQSRNKSDKHPSLNWKVTILRNGREVLTTDYMAGSGNCPGYPNRYLGKMTVAEKAVVDAECETGMPCYFSNERQEAIPSYRATPILPEFADVLYSLASEASAIDYATFEEWASDYGYDTDSRSAEKTYRACLEIALKLRSAIGDDGLAKLRESCQDY